MNQVEGCCTVSTEQSGLSLSSAGDAFAVLASPVTRHSRTGAMPSASSQRRSGSPCEGQSSGQLQQSRREAHRTTSGRNSPICQAEQAPRRSTKREQEEQHKRCRTCAKQPFHERCPARLTRPPLHGCHHCRLGLRHGRLYLQLLARQRTVLCRPLGREGRTHRPNARRLPSNAAAPLPPHHPPPTPTVANRIALMSLREGELVRWQPHRGRRRSLPPQCREAS